MLGLEFLAWSIIEKNNLRKAKSLIYLAGPYTHHRKSVKATRAALLTLAGVKLINQGKHIWSPITESHQYSLLGVQGKWDFWQEHDLMMMDRCDELYVLKIPGWDKSVGVTAEIEYATKHKKPITYLEESFLDD